MIVEDDSDDYDDDDDMFDSDQDVSIVSAASSDNPQTLTMASSQPPNLSTCWTDDPAKSSAAKSKSLLDCVHRPTSSELARKRKIDKNPPKWKKKSKGSHTNDPKSVTPLQRVKQYSNECLSV